MLWAFDYELHLTVLRHAHRARGIVGCVAVIFTPPVGDFRRDQFAGDCTVIDIYKRHIVQEQLDAHLLGCVPVETVLWALIDAIGF